MDYGHSGMVFGKNVVVTYNEMDEIIDRSLIRYGFWTHMYIFEPHIRDLSCKSTVSVHSFAEVCSRWSRCTKEIVYIGYMTLDNFFWERYSFSYPISKLCPVLVPPLIVCVFNWDPY